MEERRRIDRVGYQAKSVIVVCDSGESIFVETCNVSPLGIAFTMPAGSPDLKGKDIIIVADTMIMYADVTRQEEQEDGGFKVAISAKKFTPEVLQYLFEHIVEVSLFSQLNPLVNDLIFLKFYILFIFYNFICLPK